MTNPQLSQLWDVGGADYPEARAADVAIVGDVRALPAEVFVGATALYQSATSVSGDLFVFRKKYIPGLVAFTDYKVRLSVQFVSNYQSGCTTGPGPLTVIKAGVSDVDPHAVADAQGILKMNIDKGSGTAAGTFVQLGDIRNGVPGCPAAGSAGTWAARTTNTSVQPFIIHTDAQGGFFIFLGIQSSFQGFFEIYFTGFTLGFELQ
jgi:hypothetical protein